MTVSCKGPIDKLKSGHQSKAVASQLTDDTLQLILSKNLVGSGIDGWLSCVHNVKSCRTGFVFRWVTIKKYTTCNNDHEQFSGKGSR